MNKLVVSLALILITAMNNRALSLFKRPNKKNYTENLALHRIIFVETTPDSTGTTKKKQKRKRLTSIVPIHDITTQLDTLLNRRKVIYEKINYIQGYTIQAYIGGSRALALKVKNRLYLHDPSYKLEVHYRPPNYIVRVGSFLDKLEAYKMYIEIKKIIPHTIIRPASFAKESKSSPENERNIMEKPTQQDALAPKALEDNAKTENE